jgi:prepilin-type N-terminal cleavage/methylation domain-containing protein
MKIPSEQSGFGLFEIIIVVLLLGILASLTVNPMKKYSRRIEFRNSERGIKRLIQTAQSRAMANPDVHVGVAFDFSKSQHRAFAFEDRDKPSLYQYNAAQDPLYLQPELLKRGIELRKIPGYPDAIVFRGDGSAYKSMKIVITDGILEDTLDILASTGRVRLGF